MQILSRVQFGSLEHLLPIIVALILCWFLFYLIKTQSDHLKFKVFKGLGIFVSGFMAIFHLYKIGQGSYSLQTDLPLFLCSFMALFIFIFTFTRRFLLFEILFFWTIIGTSQGVITPDIEIGFPSYDYIRYWIVHLGLLTIIAYAIVVLKMRPKFKSVFKSFVVLQVYVLIIMVINYLLDANYSYLNNKPLSGSVLDLLGDWPNYVIVVQLALLPLFLLIYLPFFWSNKYYKTKNNNNNIY
ncbi:TIGR02206 family membrane protein [Olleya marilimosa]|uniref:YwaF family protein n=1 Tax=Olleya marilimosa TaxID=272164 RepID=UPI0030EE5C7E|tara:strand:+ start:128744 stop:129466 length:723 start_codon:yes stop_codon:yes gene_type:complete